MINIAQIAHALVKAQSEMSNAVKGSSNPFFKSKYADLNSIREAVLPVLNSHGISVLQPTCSIDGKNYVKTILLHESGEFLESFTEVLFAKQNDAQAQGSGISYARRYGLQSFVCVGADDDDGQKAMQQPKPKAVVIQSMTDDQFNKAMESDLDTISKFLNAISKDKLKATDGQIMMLQNQLHLLSTQPD